MIEDQGGSVRIVRCDHFRVNEIEALFNEISDREEKVDLLVNNVWSGYQDQHGNLDINTEPFVNYFWKQPEWRWDSMFNSLKAHYLTSKFAIPLMLKNQSGMIISTTFWDNDKLISNLPYDVSKNAIHRMIKAMDYELKDLRVFAYETIKVIKFGICLLQYHTTSLIGSKVAIIEYTIPIFLEFSIRFNHSDNKIWLS